MPYKIVWDKEAAKELATCKKSNPLLFSKIASLLHELVEYPRLGAGRPEALRGGGDRRYSRRITSHDRLVYDIFDQEEEVLIIQAAGHYDDK